MVLVASVARTTTRTTNYLRVRDDPKQAAQSLRSREYVLWIADGHVAGVAVKVRWTHDGAIEGDLARPLRTVHLRRVGVVEQVRVVV